MLRALLARASTPLTRALPSQCAVCHGWPAQPVCDACVARFAQPRLRCRTCAIAVEGGAERCGDCVLHPPPLSACIAAVDYGYPWAGAIARLKFQAEPGWAAPLAALMIAVPAARDVLADAALLLPMPLDATRLRERGYNQSLLLARRLARSPVEARLLLRIRPTAPQPGLDRAQRQRNVRGAFAVDPLRLDEVAGRHVALVDDVMTTGASLHAAADALLRAGAARVSALVIARTPAH